MSDLLGGKGAGLAEMTKAGLPTPPGFTITTEACNDYFAAGERLPDGLWDDVLEAMQRGRAADRQGLRRSGQPAARQRPLRRQVLDARDDGHGPQPRPERGRPCDGPRQADRQRAVRLGRVPALHPDVRPDRHGRRRPSASTSRSRPRKHGPRRTPRTPTSTVDDLAGLVARVQGRSSRPTPAATSPTIPTSSWTSRSRPCSRPGSASAPQDYRKSQKIAHDLGTAVNVVTMVFGNMGDDSGTGVAFTRDPNTGENGALRRVPHQRPGRGRRRRHPDGAEDRRDARPTCPRSTTSSCASASSSRSTTATSRTSSSRSSAAGCTCSRPAIAKRTAAAAVRIAADMVDEGVISQGGGDRADRARRRSTSSCATSSTRPALQDREADREGPQRLAGRGRRASAVFSADTAVEWVDRGEKVVLVRIETSPDDFHGMAVAQGILTARGGATSPRRGRRPPDRQAVRRGLARSSTSTTATKSAALRDHGRRRSTRATWISLDGATGEVYLGAAPDGPAPGSRTSPSSRRSSAGRTRSGGWASGRTPTSPRRPPRPAATAPRASGCAARSTCSARASGSRSCAARSSSPTSRPGPRRRRPPARS